jgi:hypothetical protein
MVSNYQKEIADWMEGKTVESATITKRFVNSGNVVRVTFKDGTVVRFTVNEPSVWMEAIEE